MHKLLVLYPTGQDAKKFRPYYEQTHAALVAKLPGLKGSRYSFNVKAAGDAPAPITASSKRNLLMKPRWAPPCSRRKARPLSAISETTPPFRPPSCTTK